MIELCYLIICLQQQFLYLIFVRLEKIKQRKKSSVFLYQQAQVFLPRHEKNKDPKISKDCCQLLSGQKTETSEALNTV